MNSEIMKPLVNFFFLAFISIVLITGCEKEEPNDEEPLILKGNVISNTGCKSVQLESDPGYTPDTLECIAYSFDPENHTLTFLHANAAFNCGLAEMLCEVSLTNDTLILWEIEPGPYAECMCLFDIEIEFTGVESVKYQVEIRGGSIENEVVMLGGKKFGFEMDLTNDITGTYCITHKSYPWGSSLNR